MNSYLKQWSGTPHRDVLSGLAVAFAMSAQAIAFSGIAGVDPRVDLFSALVLSTECRGYRVCGPLFFVSCNDFVTAPDPVVHKLKLGGSAVQVINLATTQPHR